MDTRWADIEAVVRDVVRAFYVVYNKLGFGFLERVYAAALARELLKRNHVVRLEVNVRVYVDGEPVSWQRIDMLVDERLVVEIKSTRELHPIVHRILYNYLRSTLLEDGLVLHFGPSPRFFRHFCRTRWA